MNRSDAQVLPEEENEGDALAKTVSAWLEEACATEMKEFGPVVESALRTKLAKYDAYEAATLTRLNDRVSAMMRALGHTEAGTPLATADLSLALSRTLRDWLIAPP